MSRPLVASGLALYLAIVCTAVRADQAKPTPAPNPAIVIQTAKGEIEIELLPASAPKTVERILELARGNFYRGQRFHWVSTGVAQFGDPLSRDMTKREEWGRGGSGRPIGVAEPSKGPFVRGSVGMAYRTNLAAATADSQIFILTGPNPALNGKFAMVGKVTRGIEVVEKIVLSDLIRVVTVK